MIKFIKISKFSISLSIILILLGVWFMTGDKLIDTQKVKLGLLTPKGLQYGIDFKGGLVFQITVYSGEDKDNGKSITIDDIRKYAVLAGLGNEVQEAFINENRKIGKAKSFIIKTSINAEEQKLIDADPNLTTSNFLTGKINSFIEMVKKQSGETYELKGEELKRANELYPDGVTEERLTEKTDNLRLLNNVVRESTKEISPSYSKALKWQAIILILFVLAVMLIYITFRFTFKYGVGAILALVHDVLMMLSLIAFVGVEIDYTIIAAILFIIGYSINDTIVVFDRIRENFGIMKESSEALIIDSSINQTLSRTIITSLTTFVAIFALFLWGGEKIYAFSLVVIAGLVSGTYSSVFIAAPIVEVWDRIFGSKKQKAKSKAIRDDEKIRNDEIKDGINNENSGIEEKRDNYSNMQSLSGQQKVVLSKKQLKKIMDKKKI